MKPFFARELAARVLAVRRRRDPDKDNTLRAGHVEIDITARAVTVAGARIELTAKEFDLLAFLVARPGHVFSRDDLLRAVWHSASEWQQPATVTEHVRRLRTKLQVDPQQPQLLQTVRGAGYRFDPPAGNAASLTSEPTLQASKGTLVHARGASWPWIMELPHWSAGTRRRSSAGTSTSSWPAARSRRAVLACGS